MGFYWIIEDEVLKIIIRPLYLENKKLTIQKEKINHDYNRRLRHIPQLTLII